MEERIGSISNQNIDARILSLVKDLSRDDEYSKKHAAWTLARLAQKGKAGAIVQAGGVKPLAELISDPELLVSYRAIWALSMMVKHGQKKAVQKANISTALYRLVEDKREIEIAHAASGELEFMTLGELAREALLHLEED